MCCPSAWSSFPLLLPQQRASFLGAAPVPKHRKPHCRGDVRAACTLPLGDLCPNHASTQAAFPAGAATAPSLGPRARLNTGFPEHSKGWAQAHRPEGRGGGAEV